MLKKQKKQQCKTNTTGFCADNPILTIHQYEQGKKMSRILFSSQSLGRRKSIGGTPDNTGHNN
jgi:hypothetical protein